MKIFFYNYGILDINSALIFGVSAKETNNPIGKFGTGLKYAISIILRLGGSISINSGGERYTFGVKAINARGKEFYVVTMNGDDLGFTTHLGSHWEPWQAYRELYCNALDEGGGVTEEFPSSADTVISVECDSISRAHLNRDKYFIDSAPIYSDGVIEIHEGGRPFHYYRGVAVYPAKRSVFSYNALSHVELSEDRMALYPYNDILIKARNSIRMCSNSGVIERFVLSAHNDDKFNDISADVSKTFIETCNRLLSIGAPIKNDVVAILKNKLGIDKCSIESELTSVQRQMIEKSLDFLGNIGEPIGDYEIKVFESLGPGIMGEAKDGCIYLSMIPFNLGTKQVASTILEEYVHLKHGCPDFSREIQSWLFDKILSIGESINGEPL